MPGYPCCCNNAECPACTSPPASIDVVFTGVAAGSFGSLCSDCSIWNTTTFTVPFFQFDGVFCVYSLQLEDIGFDADCGMSVAVEISGINSNTEVRFRVNANATGSLGTFIDDISGYPVDCTANRSIPLALAPSTNPCDFTSATCEINP